jgi:hypothetical protein
VPSLSTLLCYSEANIFYFVNDVVALGFFWREPDIGRRQEFFLDGLEREASAVFVVGDDLVVDCFPQTYGRKEFVLFVVSASGELVAQDAGVRSGDAVITGHERDDSTGGDAAGSYGVYGQCRALHGVYEGPAGIKVAARTIDDEGETFVRGFWGEIGFDNPLDGFSAGFVVEFFVEQENPILLKDTLFGLLF